MQHSNDKGNIAIKEGSEYIIQLDNQDESISLLIVHIVQ